MGTTKTLKKTWGTTRPLGDDVNKSQRDKRKPAWHSAIHKQVGLDVFLSTTPSSTGTTLNICGDANHRIMLVCNNK